MIWDECYNKKKPRAVGVFCRGTYSSRESLPKERLIKLRFESWLRVIWGTTDSLAGGKRAATRNLQKAMWLKKCETDTVHNHVKGWQ